MPSVHIQARLHPTDANRPRDKDAIAVYNVYKEAGWKDRDIVREAIVALGVQTDAGWKPVHHMGVDAVHAQTVGMLQTILAIVSNLKTSGVVIPQDSQVMLDNIETGAREMAGNAMFFDIGDG